MEEERYREALRRIGGRAVHPGDSEYPVGLRALPGTPPTVYLAGAWNHAGQVVAVVGARAANSDGCDTARELAATLARNGVAIVSGLATGIDAAAHEGALAAGGPSGAVLGTSLDRCYPKKHRALQDSLARSLGLMSELPPGQNSTPSTFAARNRLLAAIADAVIVVQGDEDSGALLTAEAARKLGRPIGAFPWDSCEPLGAAPHGLIRSGAATLVRHAQDVMELLGQHAPADPVSNPVSTRASSPRGAAPSQAGLGERERRLLAALRHRSQRLDDAAGRAGLPIADAGAALVLLELMGYARREPGGAVRLRRRA